MANPKSPEYLKEIGKKTQFTSDNQPSFEARSIGQNKRYSWEKAKSDMWTDFATAIDKATGEEISIPEAQIKRWQMLLMSKTFDEQGKKVGYTNEEKDELMFKIIDKVLPKENKLTGGDDDSPLNISINLVKNSKNSKK